MKIFKWLHISRYGFDIHLPIGKNYWGTWYGLHWYWQSYPLFEIIHSHRKCNSLHQYGIIVFGLWVYWSIDQ